MEDTSAGQNGDLLSSVEAGKRFGCTNDYVARLARQGKVYGIRVGREWYVDPSSLGHFIMQVEAAKHERATRLREQRKLEFVTATAAQTDTIPEDIAAMRPRRAVLIETGALMVLGVLLGAFLFVTTHSSDRTPAAVLTHGASLIERCADDLYGGDAGNTPCISGLSTLALGAALGDVLEDIASDLGFVVRELWCDAASWFSDTACGGTPRVATIEPVVAEEPTPTIVAVSPSNASVPSSSRAPPIVAAAGAAMAAEPAYVTQSGTNSTTIIREYHEVPGKNGDSSGFSVDLFRGQVDQIYDDIQESADSSADDIDEALSDIAESFETDLLAVMGNAQIEGNLTVAGGAAFVGELAAYGPLTVPSVNATSTSATSTFAGALLASRTPTGAHTFGAWSPGVAGANPFGASLLVNPSAADADSNLISAAVNGSTKFLVDAEGDIFANSLTTTGSVTLASTTASSFVVEGDTTLGDASTDLVTVNAALLANASITLNADLSMSGLATLANASTTVLSVSGSTHFPGGIWNASGNLGIGTTSPAAKLGVAGDAFIGGDLIATGTVTFSGVTNGLLYANGLGAVSASSTIGASILDANVIFSQEIDTSAELAAIIGDETGDGALVFAGSPTLTGVATLANASTTVLSVSTNSYLGTVSGGTWNGSDIDVSDYTNFTVTAAGLTLNDDTLELTSGYTVPLSASTTSWNSFYDAPSTRITAGDALTWSGNTLNFDGGDAPGGQLGGTWASPTIDDLFVLNTGDSISGALTLSGSAANIALGSNWLSGDGDDEGIFVNSIGNVGIGQTSLAAKLDILGSSSSTLVRIGNGNVSLDIRAEPTTNDRLIRFENTSSLSTGGFDFYASNTSLNASLFRIQNNGNVGIGDTTPTEGRLTITSAGGATYPLYINPSTGSGFASIRQTGGNYFTLALGDASGNTSVMIDSAGSSYFNGGNVGIGTTSPATKLQVTSSANNQQLHVSGINGAQRLELGYDTISDYGRIQAVFNGVGTRALALNPSGGNVGVGTAEPGYPLEVNGNVMIDSGYLMFSGGNAPATAYFGANWGANVIGWSSSGGIQLRADASTGGSGTQPISFYTNDNERMRITSSGNVGIGTNNPTQLLDVDGGSAGEGIVRAGASNQGDGVLMLMEDTASLHGFSLRYEGTDNVFQLNRHDNNASGENVITIPRTSGNIGIGTTSPSSKFNVVTSSGVGAWLIKGNTTGVSNDSGLWQDSSNNMQFAARDASGTLRVVLDSKTSGPSYINAGNVGIGTTNPGNKLSVSQGGGVGSEIPSLGANGGTLGVFSSNQTYGIIAGSNSVGRGWIQSQRVDGTATAYDLLLNPNGGNVGVGTTNPLRTLEISGSQNIFATTTPTTVATARQLTIGEATNNAGYRLALGYWLNSGQYQGVIQATAGGAGTPLLLNPGGGNIGIGTTTPDRLLTVSMNNANTSTSNMRVNQLGAGNAWMNFSIGSTHDYAVGVTQAGQFQIGYNPTGGNIGLSNNTRLTIDTTGNIGIGTTSPVSQLALSNTGDNVITLAADSDNSDEDDNPALVLQQDGNLVNSIFGTMGFSALYTGARANATFIESKDAGGAADIQFVTGGTTIGGTNGTARMTILAGGNVGIGNTSPDSTLEVTGTGAAPSLSADTGIFKIGGNITQELAFGEYTTSPFAFWMQTKKSTNDGSSWPLAINPLGGNVGIGTTTPAYKLDVNGVLASRDNALVGYVPGSSGGVYVTKTSQYGAAAIQAITSGFGTAELAVNPGGGNVGIGTAAPEARLHVLDGTNAGNDRVILGASVLDADSTLSFANAQLWLAGDFNETYNGTAGTTTAKLLLGGYDNDGATIYPIYAVDENGGVDFFIKNRPSASGASTAYFQGNVGIGSSAPNAPLSFNNTLGGCGLDICDYDDYKILLYDSGVATSSYGIGVSGSGVINFNSVGGFAFTTNGGTNEVNILPNAVGIGTNNPLARLHVQGVAGSSDIFAISSSTTSRLLTVTSAGNVGIGTSTPTAKLSVYGGVNNGAVNIGPSGNYSSIWLNGSVSGAEYNFLSSAFDRNLFINRPTGEDIQFRENNATQVTILTGGNVGIGTTTPSTKLDIRGTAVAPATSGTAVSGIISISGSSNNVLYAGTYPGSPFGAWLQVADRSNLATEYPLVLNPNGGNVGIGTSTPTAQLSTTGTVRFSNFGAGTLQTDASGNLSVSSDERLKNVEGDFTRGLDAIIALEPINFTWKKSSGFDTASTYTGFSAQNVQLAIPEAVGEDPHGFLTLSDRPILAAVVNAIKELNLRVVEIADAVAGYAQELITERVVTTELCATRSDGSIECVTGDELADLLVSGNSSTSSGDSSNDAPADEDGPAADPGTDLEPDEDAGVPPTNTGGDHPEDLSVGIDDPEASGEEPALQDPESVESPTAPSEDGTPAETAIAPVDPANTPPADGGADPVAAPQAE